jgi:hypothetical protein
MTKAREQLPVEPLSNQGWNRVEQRVFAELDASPAEREPDSKPGSSRRTVWGRRLAPVLAASLVAAVVALVVTKRSADPVTETAATSRIVTTGDVTRATIGDATIEVSAQTELQVVGTEAAGQTVVLERGEATFSLPKREGRPPFRVQAGDVRVEVVGTRFIVVRDAERVSVRVTRGTVRVISRGEVSMLREGDHWNSVEPPSAQPQSPAVPDSKVSPAPAAPDHSRAEAPKTEPSASTARQRKPASVSSAPQAGSSPSTSVAPSAEPPRPLSARDRYAAASKLEAKDPNRAVALYLELAREGGGWAANALYAAGRLELERGRRAHARQLLDQYLRQFPRGPNAEDARLLLGKTK